MSAERVLAGRYRLRDELGRGGMGVVWRAYDERLARDVAVKEVRAPDVLSEHDVHHLHSRLQREAWAAGRIAHPNVVTVYDVVSEDGRPWIVMELVRGLSYDQVLATEGPQPPERAAATAAEVLSALRAAHSVGVLHRDVKPPNVLVGNDGRTVLTDFGIAVVEGSTHLTLTGQLVGSPEYLAPERAMGRPPGPASDLWSLGVLLYAAVEGRVPFRYDSVLSTMRAIVDEEPRVPLHAGPLTPVIEGLLHKDPDERLSAEETVRLLGVVAAGGDPRDPETGLQHPAPVPPVAYSPTAQSSGAWTASPAAATTGAAGGSGGFGPALFPSEPQPTGETPGPRAGRRRAVWLLAAALVAALAVAGLVWGLGNDETPTSKGGSGNGGQQNGGNSGGTDGGGGGNGAGGGGEEQKVTASLKAVRDSFTGGCPPPGSRAPYFTGTLTVRNLPVKVSYTWVTGDGGASSTKVAEFTSGGPKQRTVRHTETSHNADGTREDWIALRVTSPGQSESQHVPFSVNCSQDDGSTDSESPYATTEPSPSGSAPPSYSQTPDETPTTSTSPTHTASPEATRPSTYQSPSPY